MKHLDEIFRLADLDKKDLTQKALKLCEEAGEVAQAVLSYTKAPVCGYKNKNQGDILEEVSDVIIVALSIARKLGFSKEDINTVIENKLVKWEKKINDSKTKEHPDEEKHLGTINIPSEMKGVRELSFSEKVGVALVNYKGITIQVPTTQEEVIALCNKSMFWCHLCEDWECGDNTNPKKP